MADSHLTTWVIKEKYTEFRISKLVFNCQGVTLNEHLKIL